MALSMSRGHEQPWVGTQLNTLHEPFMQLALAQAQLAEQAGEVPVGAVLVADGQVIAAAHNQMISGHDPCAHAEIQVLRQAGVVCQNYRLPRTRLYVTLEPCVMCLGAMLHARIEACIYAAADPKTGACGGAFDLQDQQFNHSIAVTGGVLADVASHQLKAFFQALRVKS